MNLTTLLTLWPPFGTTGDAEPIAPTFLEAVRVRLLAAPGLEELTGVFLTTAPPGTPYPFLVVNEIDAIATINTSESYYEHVLVQYDVLGDDAEEVGQIGRAAREALLLRATNPRLEFEEGREMTRWPDRRRGPYADPGVGPGGDTVWRFRFEMTHLIGRG